MTRSARWLAAAAGSATALPILFAVPLKLGVSAHHPYLFALTLSLILGLLSSIGTSVRTWKRGLWSTGALWLYFLLVFFAFVVNGSLRWRPLLQAAGVALTGVSSSGAGARLLAILRSRKAGPTLEPADK